MSACYGTTIYDKAIGALFSIGFRIKEALVTSISITWGYPRWASEVQNIIQYVNLVYVYPVYMPTFTYYNP